MPFLQILSASAMLFVNSPPATPPALPNEDAAFVAAAAQNGMFEVELGELGSLRGGSAALRDEALSEMHDHRQIGHALQDAVAASGGTLPATMDRPLVARLEQLRGLSGASFDAGYRSDMERAHQRDAAAFAREASAGSAPRLRSFTAENRSVVAGHLAWLHTLPTASH